MSDLATITKELQGYITQSGGLGERSAKIVLPGTGTVFIDGNQVSNEERDADCDVTVSADDFAAITAGRLDARAAMMAGRLKIGGDPTVMTQIGAFMPKAPEAASPELSLAEITDEMQTNLARRGGVGNRSVKINFPGEGVIFLNGTEVNNDDADADCTITLTKADFEALRFGTLNPSFAFMSGKLKVRGDISLVMRLQTLLAP